MAGENRDVTGHVLVCGLEVLVRHAVSAGGVPEAEDSSSQLVCIWIVLVKSDGGDSAVSCDERGYALSDEGAEVGKRVLPDGEPVVVRMGIDEA